MNRNTFGIQVEMPRTKAGSAALAQRKHVTSSAHFSKTLVPHITMAEWLSFSTARFCKSITRKAPIAFFGSVATVVAN